MLDSDSNWVQVETWTENDFRELKWNLMIPPHKRKAAPITWKVNAADSYLTGPLSTLQVAVFSKVCKLIISSGIVWVLRCSPEGQIALSLTLNYNTPWKWEIMRFSCAFLMPSSSLMAHPAKSFLIRPRSTANLPNSWVRLLVFGGLVLCWQSEDLLGHILFCNCWSSHPYIFVCTLQLEHKLYKALPREIGDQCLLQTHRVPDVELSILRAWSHSSFQSKLHS